MKIWSKFSLILGVTGWALARTWAGPAPPADITEAIQAIQQATDPSAVVAAYANGVALDRNDPNLYQAYVSRMVDLGLPELAFHQAEVLTTMQSTNGLAWGVLAYVDARRGQMPDAISAINLAGAAAPNHPFVQRTAGEIVAWYDTKADKTKLPDNAKDGLVKLRALLEKQPAFVEAYTTAKSAYTAQASAPQAAPDQYAATPEAQPETGQLLPQSYTMAYYPSYYYDWGPTWVEPAPWWWWQPVGFFAGVGFFPFSTFVVFDNDDFFFHHHHHSFHHHGEEFFHHHGNDFFFHDRAFHHEGVNVAFHDSHHAFFHRDGQTTAFFGAAARPNTSLALSARANFHAASGFASSSAGVRTATGGARLVPPVARSAMPNLAPPRSSTFVSSGMATPRSVAPRSGVGGLSPTGRTSGMMPAPAFNGARAPQGFGAPAPAFASPHSSPQATPMNRGFAGGGFRGGGMAMGGGFHGGGHR